MTHYLFVESNTTGSGAIALRMLRERGDDVTFVTRDRSRYPFLRDVPEGTRIVDAETNDVELLIARVQTLSAENAFDAVVTFSTFYVAIVATLAKRLGLRFLDERAAATCHDKIAARRALQAAGLPNPAFWQITSEDMATRVAADVMYPCVMKPPADSGSSGVLQIADEAQFLEHYRLLASVTTNDRGQQSSSAVLVEALLDGPEVSVESMTLAPGVTRILGITRKHLSAPPHFVELGHDFPAVLSATERDAIEECVLRGLDAVGYDFGPAHTEVRLPAKGPVIVEINPRLAGGMIPELVRLATGIDLLDAYLRALAGQTPSVAPTRERTASIRFLVAPHAGTLEAPPRYDDLLELPGVDRIELTKKSGAVSAPRNAYDRLGYVIVSGDIAAGVAERASKVAAILNERLRAAIR
jgi:biotin carboxylase